MMLPLTILISHITQEAAIPLEKSFGEFGYTGKIRGFRNPTDITAESGRQVAYRSSGTIFSNHMGAVDLEIEFITPEQFRLKRKPFTIWQNNCNDVYTLMALPVEETLHYYVGRATDRQLAESLRLTPPTTITEAQQLAEAWIAVEEAIVGGLVSLVVITAPGQ